MTELETLLRRYAEGTITQEEHQRLAILSHRDEVLAGAAVRAKRLRRQRAARLSLAASVMIVVAIVAAVALRSGTPAGIPDTVMEARMEQAPALATQVETMADPAQEVVSEPVKARPSRVCEVAETDLGTGRKAVEATDAMLDSSRPAQPREEPPVTVYSGENYPVVACNSECSPDSVINDIWRFLRV